MTTIDAPWRESRKQRTIALSIVAPCGAAAGVLIDLPGPDDALADPQAVLAC